MTHKEFYIWLEGYLHGKLENKNVEIGPIVKKMGEVKDSQHESAKSIPFEKILVPINPLPKNDDPYKPPYEIYCGTKNQLND
jgi:hypothetical protein